MGCVRNHRRKGHGPSPHHLNCIPYLTKLMVIGVAQFVGMAYALPNN